MITQTRTNLKFIGAVLFAITFIIGGFFINTTKVSAEQSFQLGKASSYTMSSYINSASGISTIARVGCDPQSGDKYDINTGKLCSYATSDMRVGCVAGSGDKYDINTGKFCASLSPNIRTGCTPNSIDIYDINTGKRCTNNTSVISPILTTNTIVNKGTPAKTIVKSAPNLEELVVAPIQSVNELANAPVEKETLKDSITASAERVGSIFKGPMSIWIILLIIIILLGGGYGIYGFIKKDLPTHVGQAGKKEEVKKIITEPILQHRPVTPVTTPITPQVKTPTPQVPPLNREYNPIPQVKNPNTQTPLNIPNNPNPQEPFLRK